MTQWGNIMEANYRDLPEVRLSILARPKELKQTRIISVKLVRQELSKCIFRQSYFSSDQGGKTGIIPKHNEDFSNAEQEEKNKYKCASISFLTH